jgi:hypothetical protein
MAPEVLELKVFAQVMLLKNIDATLVNGTLGKVVAFDEQDNPIVDFFIIDGDKRTTRRMTVQEERWSIEDASHRVVATRLQVCIHLLIGIVSTLKLISRIIYSIILDSSSLGVRYVSTCRMKKRYEYS